MRRRHAVTAPAGRTGHPRRDEFLDGPGQARDAALPGIAYLALATRVPRWATWPFSAHASAYARDAARPIAALLAIWLLAVNLLSPGEPFPLPYVPLANPLEIALVLALIVF